MAVTLAERIQQIVGEEAVRTNVPMSSCTTFRIGGPADVLVRPSDNAQIRSILELCRENEVPVTVIGNGSNLLVSDAGFRGVIIRLDQNFQKAQIHENTITAQAGLLLANLAALAREHDLTGLEYASGIPGTVGGAVWMNAGAYDGEIRDSFVCAEVLTRDLEEKTIPAEEMDLSYRHSRAMEEGWIVLQAEFRLEPGNPDEIRAKTEDYRKRRMEKQPLEWPSAGSTFKRPEGDFAGRLIEASGLKGVSVGGAQVSEKHAGFVINTGGATARDVYGLIRLVQSEVKLRHGVELQPEIRFIGDFSYVKASDKIGE